MTKLIQPLDLIVNGVTKAFRKRKITEWYNCCISAQLHIGKDIEDLRVPWKFLILKLLQAKWSINLFNSFTSEKSREIISNVLEATFITEALSSGSLGLNPLDPFQIINP